MPAPVRAQVGFGVPVLPGDVAGPLILLLIPLALSFSKADWSSLSDFEARGDWQAVEALASRRLAKTPDDVRWLEVRGRARQRLGQYPEAIEDLRLALDRRRQEPTKQADAAFATGMSLGFSEMALGDWPAAMRTMDRLSALAPARWEPDYNRGVILARQCDVAGAAAAMAALRSRQPAMAASLQRYVAAFPACREGAEAPAIGATEGSPDIERADVQLAVSDRALRLPRARWILADTSTRTVLAARGRNAMLVTPETIEVTMQQAYALSASGRVAAAVSFAANAKPTSGASIWNVADPCDVQATLHRTRFRSGWDRPECLSVRVVDRAAPDAVPSVAAALRAAQSAGAHLPELSYEVQYTRYGDDHVVAVTWWMPVERSAGDLSTIEWAHALAAQLRPLAGFERTGAANVPLLPPLQ